LSFAGSQAIRSEQAMWTHQRFATAILAALAIAPAAMATDLSNNLANPTLGSEASTATRRLAASFATDASTHALTSVTLKLGNSLVGDTVLALYSDGGLEPGTQITTLSSP